MCADFADLIGEVGFIEEILVLILSPFLCTLLQEFFFGLKLVVLRGPCTILVVKGAEISPVPGVYH